MPPYGETSFEFVEPEADRNQENVDLYLMQAKQIVIDHYAERGTKLTPNNVYIVWFVKTLQHWKSVLSTTQPDDRIFELTHNGDKNETYVDMYIKATNYAVSDDKVNPEQPALFDYRV